MTEHTQPTAPDEATLMAMEACRTWLVAWTEVPDPDLLAWTMAEVSVAALRAAGLLPSDTPRESVEGTAENQYREIFAAPSDTPASTETLLPEDVTPMTPEQVAWVRAQRR